MTQKYTKKRLLLGAALMTLFLNAPSPLSAQEEDENSDEMVQGESPSQMIQLMGRISAIEAENRELRGQLEETQHQLSNLNKQMDTLSADIDYRLNNPDSGSMPLPLPHSPSEDNSKDTLSTSDVAQEYERARAFLEQGDYVAAEQAFAAFVASHPKDMQAGAAQYWLGVTHFVRGEHEKAVAAFAKGYKNYPESLYKNDPKFSKVAETLLKLAKSLGALDRKADACTTLDQLISEYPKFSTKEVTSERQKLNCK